LKYCNICKRFISPQKTTCPVCGSVELRVLSFVKEDKDVDSSNDISGKKITLNNKEFKVKNVIGRGGYGLILEVTEGDEQDMMAMKVPLTFEHYFSSGNNYSLREIESSERSILDEIEVLNKIDTDKIVKIIDKGLASNCKKDTTRKFPVILMELALCTLRDIILLEAGGKIDIAISEKIKMTSQIISTLSDLHRSGVIHRDIALENIFVVVRGGEIKYVLADFGTSRERIVRSDERTTGIIGRDKYLDPNRFDRRYRRDPRVDIFTLGIIITEIFIGNLWDNIIFEPLNEMDFEKEFLNSYAVGQMDIRLIKFISKALKTDISKRYKDADEMEKKFKTTVLKMVRSDGLGKIVRMIDLLFSIPLPIRTEIPGKDNLIYFENHRKISLDINLRNVIVFREGRIRNVSLKGASFFKVYSEGDKVYIEADREKFDKNFGFFKRKKYSSDRGILYFTGKLRIESRSEIFDLHEGRSGSI